MLSLDAILLASLPAVFLVILLVSLHVSPLVISRAILPRATAAVEVSVVQEVVLA